MKNSEYYKEITGEEFTKMRNEGHSISFSKNQFHIIKKYDNDIKLEEDRFTNSNNYIYIDDKCWIVALKDEWFIFSRYSKYYLCDQWDGLMECLKDKNKIFTR